MAEGDLAVGIASIAVIITVAGIYLSNKRTKDSNDLLKKDIDSRIRPWLKISDIHPTHMFLKNGDSLNWDEYNIKKVNEQILPDSEDYASFSYSITNVGLVSTEIHRKTSATLVKFSKEELKSSKKDPVINIVPNEEFRSNLKLPYDKYKALNENPFYYGVHIDYEWDGGVSSVGKIWALTLGTSKIDDSW